MTDENSKSEKDHWRRLAQELGLPFDDADDAKKDSVHVESRAPEALPPPPPHRFTEYTEDDEPIQPAPSSRVAAEQPGCFQDAEPTQSAFDAPPDAPELESGEGEAKSRVRLEPVDAAGAEAEPRRGRRRRGRGRGERRPGDEDAAAARGSVPEGNSEATTDAIAPGPELPTLADAPDEDGPDEKDGEEPADGEQPGRRKRRRRRRRRKPDEGTATGGPTHEPAAAIPAAEERPAPRPAIVDELDDEPEDDEGDPDDQPHNEGADDDEPEEDFSDWNVPSWNELIAALYRPDR